MADLRQVQTKLHNTIFNNVPGKINDTVYIYAQLLSKTTSLIQINSAVSVTLFPGKQIAKITREFFSSCQELISVSAMSCCADKGKCLHLQKNLLHNIPREGEGHIPFPSMAD